jgi:transposase, IS30 family
MTYHQLTSEERYRLSACRAQGLNQAQIARQLGRHRSTIGREVKRNSSRADGNYRPSKAIERTNGRRSRSRRNQRFTLEELHRVEALLRQQWSPEQVAGFLRKEQLLRISHETIYRHVWHDRRCGGTLHQHMRGARKRRFRKRYRSYDSRGRLAGKRHISERPAQVFGRRQIGHWEIDTVMGHGNQHCIVSLVERKTGYVLIGKLKARTAQQLNQRTIRLAKRHAEHFRTITADNGTEFHSYPAIERALGLQFYFTTPHHAWERGTNENTNGLIRQYLPKRTSMASLTQHDCNVIAHKLNTRPRKRLDFRTPEECFYAH